MVALLSLQPGVAPDGQVLGAKPDQNNVTLDGVDVNDNEGNSGFNAVLPVPLDSVQEFRTTVAGQGADQGRSSGGQVSLVTKGGSNQFHGSLYEYMRNTLHRRQQLVQQSRRRGAHAAGPQPVRRFLRRPPDPQPRLLLLQLGRSQGPQRQRRHAHRSRAKPISRASSRWR